MSMRPELLPGLRLKLLDKPGTSGDAKQLTGWRGNSGFWGESSATRKLSFAATWMSATRKLFQRRSASPQKPEVISPCNLPFVRAPQSDSGTQHSSRNKGALGHFPVPTQQTPRYPAASKPLIIILDIRYQYAIMVLLRWHDSSVPCEPCSPATRSFSLPQ